MNTTDLIIAAFGILFIISGWSKGIVRSLLGPAALVLATAAAFIYYQKTHNILISCVIGIFGPLVLGWALSLFLAVWNNIFNSDAKGEPMLPSRILGSVFHLLWGGTFVVLTVVLLLMIPEKYITIPGLARAQNNIRTSTIYSYSKIFWPSSMISLNSVENGLSILDNPEKIEKLQASPEFQSLQQEPKIQEILADEETLRQIQDKDLGKLLSNPKIMALIRDKELMEKFLDLNKRLIMEGQKETSSSPKVYEPPAAR